MAHVTTPRWLSPVSRRIVVIAIAAAAAMMLLTSLLVSNATAAETVRIIENTEGDACQALGYGVDAEEFVIPSSGGRYSETLDLGDGVSVSLTSPSNRKFVDVKIANATVNGAILFNRVDQDQGTWYDYDPAVAGGRLEPPPRDSGNDKKVVLCFDVRTEVSIDKVTTFGDGLEADSTSDYIPEGTAITFEYRVSIPSGGPAEALRIISVTDSDNGVLPAYVTGDDGDDILQPGETWIYRAEGTWTRGEYTNLGTVNAEGVGSQRSASDSDASGYFGSSPAVGIDKRTSGYESDPSNSYVGPGDNVFIKAGDGVLWTYTVTNDGNVPLSNIAVTDNDPDVSPLFVSGDAGNDGILGVNETWIYQAANADPGAETSTIASTGYQNTGRVTATAPSGSGTVDPASDTSGYFGYVATFDVDVKLLVGVVEYDPTAVPFPVILAGESVTWRFVVTNTGNVPVTATIVSEVDGSTEPPTEPPICILGDIPPGDPISTEGNPATCDYVTTADDGETTTSFKVVGNGPNGTEVSKTFNDVGYYGGLDCGANVRSLTGDKVVDDGPDVWFWVGEVSVDGLECGTAVEVTASLTSDSQVASIVPAEGYPFIGTGIATITWDAIPRDDEPLVRTRQLDADLAVIEQCAVVIPIVPDEDDSGFFELADPDALYPDAVSDDGDICLIQQFNYQVEVMDEAGMVHVYMQLQEVFYIWNDPQLIRPK